MAYLPDISFKLIIQLSINHLMGTLNRRAWRTINVQQYGDWYTWWLAVDGWAVTVGTARRAWAAAPPSLLLTVVYTVQCRPMLYITISLLSCASILTRDIDIANLSVRPSVRLSVRNVPVSDENGLTYRRSFFHHTVANHSSFISIKHLHKNSDGVTPPVGALNTGWV